MDVTADHRAIEGLYHPINSRPQLSYFLDRVLGVQKLWFDGDRLLRKPLLAGEVVHVNSLVLKPASNLLVYGQLAIALLWAVAIGSSVIYFLVWGVRKQRRKIDSGATISVRLWPLLASLSVIVFLGAFMIGMTDPFARLSSPTSIAITVMIATAAFALFAALGVQASITARHAPMNRVNYWHSTIASFTHLIVAIYLFWFGIIGLMTWA
jgi:hypothetical protein